MSSSSINSFDTRAFLKFLFCAIFMSVCGLLLIFYVARMAGIVLTLLLRAFVLPKHTYFFLGGISLALLRGRVLFRNVEFQDRNVSIRAMDGYVTLRLWELGRDASHWTRIHEYMLTDALVGTRCRVTVNLTHYRGTVAGVDRERRKIHVRLDNVPPNAAMAAPETTYMGDDDYAFENGIYNAQFAPPPPVGAMSSESNAEYDAAEELGRSSDVATSSGNQTFRHLLRPRSPRVAGDGQSRASSTSHAETQYSSVSATPLGLQRTAVTATSQSSPPPLPNVNNMSASMPPNASAMAPDDGGGGGEEEAGGGNVLPNATADAAVVKIFDVSAVSVPSERGRCQVHVNGLRLCLFNATDKYRDLAAATPPAPPPMTPTAAAGANNNNNNNNGRASASRPVQEWVSQAHRLLSAAGRGLYLPRRRSSQTTNSAASRGPRDGRASVELDAVALEANAAAHHAHASAPSYNTSGAFAGGADDLGAARARQAHQRVSKSFMQRFFCYVGAVELELFAATMDLGDASGQMPYYLHTSFRSGEGRIYLTRDSCPMIDLHRTVVEMTLENCDARMSPMQGSKWLNEVQVALHQPTLRERAELWWKGAITSGARCSNNNNTNNINNAAAGNVAAHCLSPAGGTSSSNLNNNNNNNNSNVSDHNGGLNGSMYNSDNMASGGGSNSNSSSAQCSPGADLVREYGIFMNAEDGGSLHLVWYQDVPNVYAGELITRATLPRTGIEVLIDSPKVCYGPWLEYCRTQLWNFFFPANYRPLVPLDLTLGQPRPNAGTEFFLKFLRETTLVIPFKRRARVPAPPSGIVDSGKKGMLVASIGAGAQYVQPGTYLLPGEARQKFESFFMCHNITVYANAVLERQTMLCHIDALQFFLDRQDGLLWNERKLWNILPSLSGGSFYYYTAYARYFLDLLNDWQFAANMYHDVPLTTELFNTYERAVKLFVPNVKRFELFVDGGLTLFFNSNSHNVVYADDPNDPCGNVFEELRVESGYFAIVLPDDQYLISYANDVVRPFEANVDNLRAYLRLPPTHPLHLLINSDEPYASATRLDLRGTFTVNVENQARPRDRLRIDPATGLTWLKDYLSLDIDLANLSARMMGPHVKYLVACFQNYFIDETHTIEPSELFWLLAKLGSHATTGENRRKEFDDYLSRDNGPDNDLEISVTVRLREIDLTVVTQLVDEVNGRRNAAHLTTGLLSYTYVKQTPAAEHAITLTPVTIHVSDPRPEHAAHKSTASQPLGAGGAAAATTTTTTTSTTTTSPATTATGRPATAAFASSANFATHTATASGHTIAAGADYCGAGYTKGQGSACVPGRGDGAVWVGPVRVAVVMHYGPMPFRIKVHQVLETTVDGVVFELAMAQTAVLATLLQTFKEHFDAEDAMWVDSVSAARSLAESTAEQIVTAERRAEVQRLLQQRPRRTTSEYAPFGPYPAGGSSINGFATAAPIVSAGNEPQLSPLYDGRAHVGGLSSHAIAAHPVVAGREFGVAASRTNSNAVSAMQGNAASNATSSAAQGAARGETNPLNVAMYGGQDGQPATRSQLPRVLSTGNTNLFFSPMTALSAGGSAFVESSNDVIGDAATAAASPNTKGSDLVAPPPFAPPQPPIMTYAAAAQSAFGPTGIAAGHDFGPALEEAHMIEDRGIGFSTEQQQQQQQQHTTPPLQQPQQQRTGMVSSASFPALSHNNTSAAYPIRIGGADEPGLPPPPAAAADGMDTSLEHIHLGYADSVPTELAAGFAQLMEQLNRAKDEAKDYGLFFTHIAVASVQGALRISDEGYFSLDLPIGVHLAESTVNDGNSNKRMSLVAQRITLRALVAQDKFTLRGDEAGKGVHSTSASFVKPLSPPVVRHTATATRTSTTTAARGAARAGAHGGKTRAGNASTSVPPAASHSASGASASGGHTSTYVEVSALHTSFFVRQCTAYPFDGSLAHHQAKQRVFINTNDYAKLIRFPFPNAATSTSQAGAAAAAGTYAQPPPQPSPSPAAPLSAPEPNVTPTRRTPQAQSTPQTTARPASLVTNEASPVANNNNNSNNNNSNNTQVVHHIHHQQTSNNNNNNNNESATATHDGLNSTIQLFEPLGARGVVHADDSQVLLQQPSLPPQMDSLGSAGQDESDSVAVASTVAARRTHVHTRLAPSAHHHRRYFSSSAGKPPGLAAGASDNSMPDSDLNPSSPCRSPPDELVNYNETLSNALAMRGSSNGLAPHSSETTMLSEGVKPMGLLSSGTFLAPGDDTIVDGAVEHFSTCLSASESGESELRSSTADSSNNNNINGNDSGTGDSGLDNSFAALGTGRHRTYTANATLTYNTTGAEELGADGNATAAGAPGAAEKSTAHSGSAPGAKTARSFLREPVDLDAFYRRFSRTERAATRGAAHHTPLPTIVTTGGSGGGGAGGLNSRRTSMYKSHRPGPVSVSGNERIYDALRKGRHNEVHTRRGVAAHVAFAAPPDVTFTAAPPFAGGEGGAEAKEGRYPVFFMASAAARGEDVAAANGSALNGDDAGSPLALLQTTDNRARSQAGSTTKHIHIELIDPLSILLTRQTAVLLVKAIDLFSDAISELQRCYSSSCVNELVLAQIFRPPTARRLISLPHLRLHGGHGGGRLSGAVVSAAQDRHRRSRLRVQQKRWQTEETIFSAALRSAEVKLMTDLPVPDENLPVAGQNTTGMYTSTLALSAVRGLMWQSRLPRGVGADASAPRNLVASASLDAVAWITQIEYEPMRRENNLVVSVPFVNYDTHKDTIAVLHVTKTTGRGRQRFMGGAFGAECSVDIAAVGVHLTRDFVDYLQSVMFELRARQAAVEACVRRVRHALASGAREQTAPPPHTSAAAVGAADAPPRRRSPPLSGRPSALSPGASRSLGRLNEWLPTGPTYVPSELKNNGSTYALRLQRTTRYGGTVQGNGRIEAFDVTVISTARERRRLRVDLAHATVITVARPSLNFMLAMPNWRRDRVMQLHCIGLVQDLHIRVYPALVQVLRTRGSSLAKAEFGAATAKSAAAATLVAENNAECNNNNTTSTNNTLSAAAMEDSKTIRVAAPATAAHARRGVTMTYQATFTIRKVDLGVMHSERNYIQLTGRCLSGCAVSCAAKESSRECVQMDALAAAIARHLRHRLQQLAAEARQRAKRSRYPAPPTTTAQLLLKSTVSFFAEQLLIQYIADTLIAAETMPQSALRGGAAATAATGGRPSPNLAQQAAQQGLHRHTKPVVTGLVEDVSLVAQFTDQYDHIGEQVNIHLVVHRSHVESPLRFNVAETVHPQLSEFIGTWVHNLTMLRDTVHVVVPEPRHSSARSSNNASNEPCQSASPPPPPMVASPTAAKATTVVVQPRNRAVVLSVQAHNIDLHVGLPQSIVQYYTLPQLAAVVELSSNGRIGAKAHVHPFMIHSNAVVSESYKVTLPGVYLMYFSDEDKTTMNAMMQRLNITFTPQFINHMMLLYCRFMEDVVPLVTRHALPFAEADMAKTETALEPRSSGSPLMSSSPLQRQRFACNVPSGAHDAPVCMPVNPTASNNNNISAAAAANAAPVASPLTNATHTRTLSEVPSLTGLHKRRSMLFLLDGLRFSFLTSMADLRFTVRSLSAIGDSAERLEHRRRDWVTHVWTAQVALVDRTDYDQQLAVEKECAQEAGGRAYTAAGAVPLSGVYGAANNTPAATPPPTPEVMSEGGKTVVASAYNASTLYLPPSLVRTCGTGANARGTPAAMQGGGTTANNNNNNGEDEEDEAVLACVAPRRMLRPRGGFVWGSAEVSFTLAGGRVDRRDLARPLTQDAPFADYDAALRQALLDNLGHSATQWQLSLYDPLVILRCGVESLLTRSVHEMQESVRQMRSAAEAEKREFGMRLSQYRTFHKLQEKVRRHRYLLRLVERRRRQLLEKISAEVMLHTYKGRRGGLPAPPQPDFASGVDPLTISHKHVFTATLRHFLLVIPFGDAAYRGILEELPGTYACGKTERHLHTALCLSRRAFVPTLALKTRVEEVSFIFQLENTKCYTSDMSEPRQHGNPARDAVPPWESYHTEHSKFTGRFLARRSCLFFSEGTALEPREVDLRVLSEQTHVLGGLGTLTSYAAAEAQRSHNKIEVETVGAPFRLERQNGTTRVGGLFDISFPRMQLSSHSLSYITQFAREFSTENLHDHLQDVSAAEQHTKGTPASGGRSKNTNTNNYHADPAEMTTTAAATTNNNNTAGADYFGQSIYQDPRRPSPTAALPSTPSAAGERNTHTGRQRRSGRRQGDAFAAAGLAQEEGGGGVTGLRQAWTLIDDTLQVDVVARLSAGELVMYCIGKEPPPPRTTSPRGPFSRKPMATGANPVQPSAGNSAATPSGHPTPLSLGLTGATGLTAAEPHAATATANGNAAREAMLRANANGLSPPPPPVPLSHLHAYPSATAMHGGGSGEASMPHAASSSLSEPPAQSSSSGLAYSAGVGGYRRALTLPLPCVQLQAVAGPPREGDAEHQVIMVRGEIRTGVIALDPAVKLLMQEMDALVRSYAPWRQERQTEMLALMKELDRKAVKQGLFFSCPLIDLLLPMPRAYATMLSRQRVRRVLRARHAAPWRLFHYHEQPPEVHGGSFAVSPGSTVLGEATTNHNNDGGTQASATALALPATTPHTKHVYTTIHLSLMDFKLVLNTDTNPATTFTAFLDEHGTIDVLLTSWQRPRLGRRFIHRHPERSLVLHVHRLRAECQAKLEVKSLELSLPEAEVCLSVRRGDIGTVVSAAAHFPFKVEGPQPNVTLRAQHMAQIFTVAQLWGDTLRAATRSARNVFTRPSVAAAVARGAAAGSQLDETRVSGASYTVAAAAAAAAGGGAGGRKGSTRLLLTVSLSHGLCTVELGLGNAHQLHFGAGRLAIELNKDSAGSLTTLFLGHVADVIIYSDGALSGMAKLSDTLLQAFVITNPDGGDVFLRSPENRTFRGSLLVRNLNVTFKERHLKDVFECKVTGFSANSMDGVGEEGYTTVDLDVALNKGTLGVTPNTMPVFLGAVRGVGALVAEQQQQARDRVREAAAAHHGVCVFGPSGESPAALTPTLQPPAPPQGTMLYRDANGMLYTAFAEPTASRSPPLALPPMPSSDTLLRNIAAERDALRGSAEATGAMGPFIPFMGNCLVRVPCGQVRVSLNDTTLLLGATSSSENSTDCVVASFYRSRLSFAECPAEDYTVARRVLVIETNNVELYRPGGSRVVILGFRGLNTFQFLTRQVLGEAEVGFVMTLHQTRPWTGNPRFRDFEEIILLIKSFTDKNNAYVFQRFGKEVPGGASPLPYGVYGDHAGANGSAQTAAMAERRLNSFYAAADSSSSGGAGLNESRNGIGAAVRVGDRGISEYDDDVDSLKDDDEDDANSAGEKGRGRRGSGAAAWGAKAPSSATRRRGSGSAGKPSQTPLLRTKERVARDPRRLKPLRSTRFSPQLRFGGDVSVNTEVILNWLGVTERMLPNVIHSLIGDGCERLLKSLADKASERIVAPKNGGNTSATTLTFNNL